METIQSLVSPEIWGWIQIVFTVIGATSVAAANIPHNSENVFWKVINLIAQNYKNAKNG